MNALLCALCETGPETRERQLARQSETRGQKSPTERCPEAGQQEAELFFHSLKRTSLGNCLKWGARIREKCGVENWKQERPKECERRSKETWLLNHLTGVWTAYTKEKKGGRGEYRFSSLPPDEEMTFTGPHLALSKVWKRRTEVSFPPISVTAGACWMTSHEARRTQFKML